MKQTIKFAWLLFAVLLLFALVFPLTVIADGSTYTVTVMVRFDEPGGATVADDGTYVQVYNATKLTANTYSFSSSGQMLQLVSNPVVGYEVLRWELNDSVAGLSTSNDEQYTVDAISGDSTITLVLQPVGYHISYENEAGFNGASLSYTTLPPDTHTYGQTTTLVAPKELQTHTFQYWTVYSIDGSTRTLLGTREAGEVLGAGEITSDIVLVAHWEPKSFAITRHDGYLDGNNDFHEFGTVSGTAEYASSVSGLSESIWDTNPTYRGYVFDAASATEGTDYTVLASVSYVAENNHVYRYYTARTYTVEYENCADVLNGWGGATAAYRTHVYNRNTVIPNPSREGYTFGGWEIVTSNGDLWNTDDGIVNLADNGDGTWTLHGKAYDSSLSGDVSIKLRAVWNPITYSVTYDSATLFGNDISAAPTSCRYDNTLLVNLGLTRTGYTFLGWRIAGTTDEPALTFVIEASTRTEDVTLEAVWRANTYTVTFDTAHGSQILTEHGTETSTVTYDAALPAITPPACEGWDFTGYYLNNVLCYHADGTPAVDAWNHDADKTLVAHWTIRSHHVTILVVDGENADRSDRVTVKVNSENYDPTNVYSYGTAMLIEITVNSGSDKMVKWNGTAISHTVSLTPASFSPASFTLGDADVTITVVLLPKQETPAFGVDYGNEALTGLTAGTYRVDTDTESWSFRVGADGSVTPYNSNHADPARLSGVFGKTLSICLLGEENVRSDSDPQIIALAARPAAPVSGTNILRVEDVVSDRPGLEVKVSSGELTYEYAYSRSDTAVPENWQDSPRIEGLNAGTPYYIYIRVKASANYPHGETVIVERTTLSSRYLAEWIQKLYGDFGAYRGGENVETLLLAAEESAKALQPSATYEEQLDSIYRGVADRVGFEKRRDDAIAELRAYYATLAATEAYNGNGSGELRLLLANAIEAINSPATASEVEVQRLFLSAYSGMDAVRVNYLSSVTDRSEVHMTSTAGVPKGTNLSVEQGDAASVRSQLRAALRRGTVVLQTGSASVTDARKLLSSKDAVAFYRMFLSAKPEDGDTLEFRLLIPENLRSETGFQVVYYDNRTETVTVLPTDREGNELLFYASSAADFVVFGEHVTHTAPVLAVLSCVILLQIVAIAVVLVGRYRARANAAAFPLLAVAALGVSPAGSVTAVWILIALAIILQGMLVYLVLSTGLIWRRRKERELSDVDVDDELTADPDDESEPTLDVPTEDDLPLGDYVAWEALDPEMNETDNAVDWTGVRPEEMQSAEFMPNEEESTAISAFAEQTDNAGTEAPSDPADPNREFEDGE